MKRLGNPSSFCLHISGLVSLIGSPASMRRELDGAGRTLGGPWAAVLVLPMVMMFTALFLRLQTLRQKYVAFNASVFFVPFHEFFDCHMLSFHSIGFVLSLS